VNNHAHVVQGNKLSNTRYLGYALGCTDVSGYLTGSTQPKLTQGALNRIEVNLPSRAHQDAIVEVLGALDEKIAANAIMVRCSIELCSGIFRRLFAPALDHVISNKGLPPEWVALRFGDVLSVLETGSRPRGGVSRYSDGVPSIGAESVRQLAWFNIAKVKYVPESFFGQMKRGILESHDILLYKDGGQPGSFEPHVSMFGNGFPFSRACINEHVYRVRMMPPLGQAFGLFWLMSTPIMNEMRRRGTGVAIPGLNSNAVRNLPVVRPPRREVDLFESIVIPLIDRSLDAAGESLVLAELRDALLPELLSGQLSVKDAEEIVEDST